MPDTTTPVQVAGFNGTFESEDKIERLVSLKDENTISQFDPTISQEKEAKI